jgi:tungstate transport system permease protein
MPIYSESFAAAFGLLASSDRDLMEILALSINVSLASLVLSCVIGLPIGAFLAMRHFPMRDFLVGVFNAMMGLPPVVVGLLVYLHLSRSGTIWLAWVALYAAGHGDCTDDFDHPDHHRAILSGS